MPDYQNNDSGRPGPLGLIWQAILLVIVLVMLSSVFAQGQTVRPKIYDGDTFVIGSETIRIETIDTPELFSPKCDAEKRLAKLAKSRLRQLLGDGTGIEIIRKPTKDRYGRTLATVRVNGLDVSEVLIREGLASPWEGHRHNWCCG